MKHTLIFAWRPVHVDVIQARSNPSDLIVSLNLDVSALLRGLNIPYHEMTDFVSAGDLRRLQDDGYLLSQTWFKSFESDCLINGVSPLANESLELAIFLTNGLIAKFLFNTVIRQYDIEAVVLFDSPTEHILFTDSVIKLELWISVWQMMAKARMLPIVQIPIALGETLSPAKPLHSIERVKQLANIVRNLGINWIAWQRRFIQTARTHKNTVSFVVMINEAHRFAQLSQAIDSDDIPIIPSVVGARSSGGILFYRSMGLLPDTQFLRIRSAAKQWYNRFRLFQQNYTEEHPELFTNPQFAPQFHAFFTRFLPNGLKIYFDAQCIFQRTRTRAVIITTYPQLHVGSIHAAARDLKIPILSLPHSGWPTDKNIRCKGDLTLVWSKDYERAWHSTQGDTPIVVTGMPASVVAQGYLQTQTLQTKHPSRKRVTLLLATIQMGMLPSVDMRQHYETLKQLAQVPAHLMDKVEVIFKLHPVSDYHNVYQSLVSGDAAHVKIIHNVPLEAVLHDSDLAVMVNVSTSAHLLALSKAVPLFYIDTVTNSITPDTLAIAEWGEGMTIRDHAQIWQQIERVLFDADARNQLLKANQRYWKRLEADEHDPVTILRDTLRTYLQ